LRRNLQFVIIGLIIAVVAPLVYVIIGFFEYATSASNDLPTIEIFERVVTCNPIKGTLSVEFFVRDAESKLKGQEFEPTWYPDPDVTQSRTAKTGTFYNYEIRDIWFLENTADEIKEDRVVAEACDDENCNISPKTFQVPNKCPEGEFERSGGLTEEEVNGGSISGL